MLESLRVTALGSNQSLPPGFPPSPLYVNQADSCTPIAFGASYMNIPYTYRGRDRLSLVEVWPTGGGGPVPDGPLLVSFRYSARVGPAHMRSLILNPCRFRGGGACSGPYTNCGISVLGSPSTPTKETGSNRSRQCPT